MSLIELPPEHLRVHDSLPFDVVDSGGRLLVPRGTLIDDTRQLQQVRAAVPMADAGAAAAWVEAREREAAAREHADDAAPERTADTEDDAPAAPAAEARDIHSRLAPLLAPGAATLPQWSLHVEALARRLARLADAQPDALLYLLVQRASRYHEHYSSEHALLAASVCRMCAAPLGFAPDEMHTLLCAALTMNLSMTALQDELAQRERTPTLAQRKAIDEHAADSARLLRQAGVGDELWTGTVALHHRLPDADTAFTELDAVERLASVLRRVDVFTAKISARRSRSGLPAPLAARDACLGPDGRPDLIGQAMIKALSIYPPGSYVRLANSETAVVVRRGARADRPLAASVLAPNGRALGEPVLRDTLQPRHEIRAAVRANEVRVALNHEQVLALAGAAPN